MKQQNVPFFFFITSGAAVAKSAHSSMRSSMTRPLSLSWDVQPNIREASIIPSRPWKRKTEDPRRCAGRLVRRQTMGPPESTMCDMLIHAWGHLGSRQTFPPAHCRLRFREQGGGRVLRVFGRRFAAARHRVQWERLAWRSRCIGPMGSWTRRLWYGSERGEQSHRPPNERGVGITRWRPVKVGLQAWLSSSSSHFCCPKQRLRRWVCWGLGGVFPLHPSFTCYIRWYIPRTSLSVMDVPCTQVICAKVLRPASHFWPGKPNSGNAPGWLLTSEGNSYVRTENTG